MAEPIVIELNKATDPASDLSLYPRHQGVFISVRYSGNGTVAGKLHLVDGATRQSRAVQTDLTTVL